MSLWVKTIHENAVYGLSPERVPRGGMSSGNAPCIFTQQNVSSLQDAEAADELHYRYHSKGAQETL